ncbi:MAG: hypothetical protein OJJ21_01520 [Ferrovibrio sp.]|uniref:hypothetical protein n=1 Tax=Ferrovibrio sp. TaxID=1917215 RepID=UPI00262CBCC2|nr:hypothetical protein [Ferrovibrio sp.]MCW0232254.1 hypothetical protein [Ferrovibrio sp.]
MSGIDFTLLAMAARGLATAGFVGGVVALMERSSPFIGGIVLALPIVTAPAYLFIILHHEPVFVAQAALGSLATLGAVLLFLVCVIALVGRAPMPLALLGGLTAWFATGLLIRSLPAALWISLGILAATGLIAWLAARRVPMTAPAARGRSPWSEIVLRGATAGLLVAAVSGLAHLLGPTVAGIFASFPVALLTVCWFIPRRLEDAGIRAALRATEIGLVSHMPFFLSLALLGTEIGALLAFTLGITGSLGIAVTLALLRRRHLRKTV